MKCLSSPAGPGDWQGELLVVGLFSQDGDATRRALETRFGSALLERLEAGGFKAKPGSTASFDLLDGPLQRLVLIGLGAPESFDLMALRRAAAAAAQAGKGMTGSLGLCLPLEGFEPSAAAQAIGESVRLAGYSDQRFRSEPHQDPRPERCEILQLPAAGDAALERVAPICSGVELARELVAAPANALTPEVMADTASAIARDHGLEVTILDAEACRERGMGSYLAVAQGSDLPPRFIHLIYRPEGTPLRRLALVGKGLTFDSGGYNLKVGAAQIHMMKYDMGGSAAVLGAARAIAELKPAGVEVHFIVAACENMINGSAIHPGDIITASNGKTIEINNTDAEGRLTLADALVYASELKPDAIVDLATLTGACVIALGEEIAGLWSSSDSLSRALSDAARSGGEQLWAMPMPASYADGLKSDLADMKNTGPRPGGSITAALFLKEFVAGSIPWAHLDIAGTVWSDKPRQGQPSGASGFGVRTLVEWVSAGGLA
ncbi:leucyl aminopeptidase [Synechococcus sp. RSCCF101]|uniref:leucyl aminopeptidase n=1 Tax=Synechococcus sp. RSCCF101 TaxID=2511069 RepID=UPI00124553E7|nr:leucyl aminopeptidase [Synechococcus sp. RSCCF101]QEY33182.1 leucyl aminopeptidase [Synechococcus sp. RSCCF101]